MQRNKARQPVADVTVVPNGVTTLALLPNPAGQDQGNEKVVIGNGTDAVVDLVG
jgi:hypothetical protein